MSKKRKILIAILVILVVLAGIAYWLTRGDIADFDLAATSGTDPVIAEPEGGIIPTVNVAEAVGWGDDEVPQVAEGLAVTRFADGLDHPRIIHTLPNGDVLVALTNRPPGDGPGGIEGFVMNLLFERAGAASESADEIMLLRDRDGDSEADARQVIANSFESPSGMAWKDGTLYVAQHDGLFAADYALGQTSITGTPRKLMNLPPAGNHWMRNIVLSPEGDKLYVAVGSSSNIGENGMAEETGRAMIWEYDLASGRQRQYATGMRNPNGLAYSPWSGELWATVNERDMLGSDLVPDYFTNVPVGAQYGWPWYYWGDRIDRRIEAPIPQYLGSYVRRPEYAMGPHVAALGLAFTTEGNRMGSVFSRGAFVARHGSWNRKPASGYDVVFVEFDERGNPLGKPQAVLGGFLNDDGSTNGRPTWVEWAQDGALLVSDDTAGIIWRVIAPGAKPAAAPVRTTARSLPQQKELRGGELPTFE